MTPPTTGFEDSGGAAWTTLAEEQGFLEVVDAETDAVLSTAGASVQGRPIWRIDIGTPTLGTYLVVGNQHADEPAGREAALQQVRDLAYRVGDGLRVGASGEYASTPDDPALDITADLDVRAEVTPDQWGTGSLQYVVAKWDFGVNQRSYTLRLTATGGLQLAWSTTGINVVSATATAPIPVADGQRLAVRATLDVDNGAGGYTATFWTAPSIEGPWEQLGDPVVGAAPTSVFASSSDLDVAAADSGTAGPFAGTVHAVEVYAGIGGTAAADPDFTAHPAGTTAFTDAAGRPWAVLGAQITGITHYLSGHRIVYVPNANPDGIAAGNTHRNANDVDLNRAHWSLTEPEARTVQAVHTACDPTIVVDLHERDAVQLGTQMLWLRPELLVLYQGIGTKGDQLIAALQAAFNTAGISHDLYPNPGRQSLREAGGLRHAIGFLLETRMVTDTTLQRVQFQRLALDEIRTWHETEAAELANMAEESRIWQATTDTQYVLQTTNFATDADWPQTLLPEDLTGYELDQGLSATVRDTYGIAVSTGTGRDRVFLGQQARAIIPILLDQDSDDQQVGTTRLIAVAGPGEPGEGGMPEVAVARITNVVTWLACDLVTGGIMAELPNLQGDEVSRIIGRHTSSQLALPIPAVGGPNLPLADRALLADRATRLAQTMLVVVVNDIPTWAGIPLPRDRGTDATIPLGCVSLEGYLEHRYVSDHRWDDADESTIVAGLLADAGPIPGVGEGIGLIIDAPPTGTTRSRTYLASDHKTVYEALTELMAVRNGPEWTIDVDWGETGTPHRAVAKIFRLRKRLGTAHDNPPVFSSLHGESEATYLLKEDRSGDAYANYVVAYSSGEGEDQPTSAPALDAPTLATGIPIWEKHFQPSSSIKRQSVLDNHAQAELARIKGGSTVLEVTARWNAYPRFGVDWRLGDDISFDLRGHAHPQGLTGTRRAVGFAMSIQGGTIKPILQEDL